MLNNSIILSLKDKQLDFNLLRSPQGNNTHSEPKQINTLLKATKLNAIYLKATQLNNTNYSAKQLDNTHLKDKQLDCNLLRSPQVNNTDSESNNLIL